MKDFEKAKIKKQKRSPRRFNIAGYDYLLWYEIPFVPFMLLSDWQYNRMKWDEKKATKVLNKILPAKLEWVPEDNAFYYCMDYEPNGLVNKAPFYYKRWVGKFRYELHQFVAKGYQNADYNKTIIDDYGQWVKFEERGG